MIEFTKVSNCMVCESSDSETLLEFYSKDENLYEARKCLDCGLVYASPQPVLNIESINEIYSSDYYANYYGEKQDYQNTELVDYYMACYEKEYAIYNQYVDEKDNRKVFDVGCGDGKFLEIFRKHGWQCLGLEPSESSRKLAISKGFEVIDSPFLDVGKDIGKFDLIFLDNVIEHINEPIPFLAKAYDLLNPGGAFVLKTPNSSSLNESLETVILRNIPTTWSNALMRFIQKKFNQGSGRVHRYGNLHPPVHLAIYNDKSMTRALSKAGFSNGDVTNFFVSPHHPNWGINQPVSGGFNQVKKKVNQIANRLNRGEYLISIARRD